MYYDNVLDWDQSTPVEIVEETRRRCGEDFIIMYRLSVIDLVPDGSTREEVLDLARAIEKAGASLINSGIGWHEARVPTIVTSVPTSASLSILNRPPWSSVSSLATPVRSRRDAM